MMEAAVKGAATSHSEEVATAAAEAATATKCAAPAAAACFSSLISSLSLTASAWSAINRAGACACCAARLAGCRDPAVYACDERDLKAQLDARFFCTSTNESDEGGGGSGGALSNEAREEKCCPLCLGLLQSEIPVRMAPRPRPSSELHGDDNRSCCEQARPPPPQPQPPPPVLAETNGKGTSPAAAVAPVGAGELTTPDQAATPTTAECMSAAAVELLTPSTATADNGVGNSITKNGINSSRGIGYSRARMVEAIAECIATRGYTVSSFWITAAVPACLVLRDAAFLEAGYGLSAVASPTPPPPTTKTTTIATTQASRSSADETTPPATATAATPSRASPPTPTPADVVPVKEALKIGLARALQSRLHIAGEATAGEGAGAMAGASAASPAAVDFDPESDFLVEVTAKAPEADAHAMTALLGGPPLSRSTPAKQHGWPGGGRWAKKRQRREEQRNPGLTVGAVKKGLAILDDAGRDRMRRWVTGLLAEGKDDKGGGGRDRNRTGELRSTREGRVHLSEAEEQGDRGVADVVDIVNADHAKDPPDKAVSDVAAVDRTTTGGISIEVVDGNSNGGGVDTERSRSATTIAVVPPLSNSRADASEGNITNTKGSDTNTDTNITPAGSSRSTDDTMEALCEVAIRRHPIHFWGRYTKHSRSVPQTPWMKGFYSVQEAVSEPFEAFSGCVEGLLHGAGREDVNVRMLGKGRPFCLELVDSLLSVDEVAAELPSLATAVNAAGGIKNAGGGVSVSRLRVAGPGELPSDVQAVGEGKRKHYRCVVWVSRAVGKEEVVKALCDTLPPEGLVVMQATPIRVLHRRTLLDRPRSIFDMRVQWINEHFFQLDLTTSAGTYIKEFVHGDLGRTVPSVGSLLNCRADILQLDVTDVEDRWSAEDDEVGGEDTGVSSLATTGREE